ncbi:MAG: hypothetical protein ABIO57_00620 [Candidatus Paceibacterota bacterium]
MKTVQFFYSTFQKYAVLSVFLLLALPSIVYAQQTLPGQTVASNTAISPSAKADDITPSTIDPAKYGTFVMDGKTITSYISKRGIELKVGDNIMLNVPSRMDGRFFNIRYAVGNFHNKLNPNSDHLRGDFANNDAYTITGISNSSSGLFGPKNAYMYFKLPGTIVYGEITIEQALNQNEFHVVK